MFASCRFPASSVKRSVALGGTSAALTRKVAIWARVTGAEGQ